MELNGSLDKIKQGLIIGIILFGVLATPAKIKISAIEIRIDKIEEAHLLKCIEADKKYSSAKVVEIKLNNIADILCDIKEQLKECRLTDKEFRDKFQDYILKHP